MRFPLCDATAVLTGAGSGIGAALAVELARRGAHLALADRNAGGLRDTAEAARRHGVRVSEHAFDLTDAAARNAFPQQVLAAHSAVSLLINNAGAALGGTFAQASETDFDWILEVNFAAPVKLMRAFLPYLERQPMAQIVNISSIFGIVAPPGQSAYVASKFALRGVSEALRHELALAGSPVRVTVGHPGGVKTNIVANARISPAMTPQQSEQAARFHANLRLLPETAAHRIADGIERRAPRILVGPDARFIDVLQRIRPVTYWNVLRKLIR